MMLDKLTGSLAYRLPNLYSAFLKYKSVPAVYKPHSNNRVLMMTGKNHLVMTKIALSSILKNWSAIPELVITSDGSLTAGEIEKAFTFWPGKLSAQNWVDTDVYHEKFDRKALIQYASVHPFGKKLAFILRHAESGPVLWIDSDVLFFNDFLPFIPVNTSGFACGGSEDFIKAYHHPVLEAFGDNWEDMPGFNAGILFAIGTGIYERFGLEKVLNSIHPFYDFCTEQTIFAHISQASLGIIWSRDVIKTFNDDNQQVLPMTAGDTIARHYTSNVRHLFWRDAFYQL
jgi:hypothetical protein